MTITFSPLTKKISLTMAVIFFIFAAGLFYINKILLPIQIKGMAIKAASDALKRNVTFDELQYSPLRGFVITNLAIAEKDAPPRAFIRAKNASAQVLFFALLQKKLILPSVKIESPEITLTRIGKDLWNFSDILTPTASAETKKSAPPMDVIVSGFSMTKGRIILNDTSLAENFSETIDIPLIKGSLSLNGAFNINGSLVLPATQGSLKFDTRLGIKDSSFKGTFNAKNISVSRYLRFSPAELPVSVQNLMIATGEIAALVQGKNASVSGDISLPAMNITLADGTKFQGDMILNKVFAGMNNADISLQGALLANQVVVETAAGIQARISVLRAANAQAALKEGLLSASGEMDAREMDLTLNPEQTLKTSVNIQGLTITQNAKGYAMSGEIKADDLRLTLGKDQNLSGQAALKKMTAMVTGSAVQAKADLNIKDATFTMPGTSVTTDILAPDTRLSFDTGRLETELRTILRNFSIKTQAVSISGTPELTAHLVLDPKAEIPLSYTGAVKLNGLELGGLPTVDAVRNLRGEITFKTDSAATDEVTFTILDTPVNLNGDISDFKTPMVNAHAVINKVDLMIIEKVIPEIVKEQGLSIKGTAALDVNFSGLLAKMPEGMINASAKLTDVSMESKKLNQKASSINGLVEYRSPLCPGKTSP